MSRVKKPAKKKVRAKPPAPESPAKKVGSTRPAKKIGSTSLSLKEHLAEALEQQAATSEILRVISSSPSDAQPVFETIAANALRLCDATFSAVFRFDGELIHIAAHHNLKPTGTASFRRAYPSPPSRGGATHRAILTGKIAHVADVLKDPEYAYHDAAKAAQYRSALSVPMLHDGRAIGTITVYRSVPKPFPDAQIQLLKTFADQAVIAVENARLFNETKEALDQQTATARILQAISGSPGDIVPVLDKVVGAAAQFCGAPDVVIVRLDGDVLRGAAAVGPFGEVLRRNAGSLEAVEMPVTRGSVAGRSVVERRSIHVHDLSAEREEEYPQGLELQRRFGHRTMVATPLLREGVPLGAICLFRSEVKPFSDKQIALLKSFADQAVIAIENVRLFTELENRNHDLTEALEQQTATSDILRVISRSPTDVQPVFDTIAAAALKLCSAASAVVTTFDGELIHVGGLANVSPEGADAVRARYPRPPGRFNAAGRAVLTRSVVVLPDVLADPDYEVRTPLITAGFRSVAAVPMLRDGNPLGAITVARPEPGPFPDKQIALLKTFADQAVIAIENVRLFTETKEALAQQTATAEILQAISSSPGNLKPVFDTLVRAAAKFCGAPGVLILRLDNGVLRCAAGVGAYADAVRSGLGSMEALELPLTKGSVSGRAVLERRSIHVHDIAAEPEDEYPEGQQIQRQFGSRTLVATPLLREEEALGAIVLVRTEVKPFSDKQLQLLGIFADQAVIAIENVRLFTELEARNRDLTEALEHQTATSEILRVISSSPTDVQPVFEIISERAGKLCDADVSVVSRVEGEQIHLAAINGVTEEAKETIRRLHPMPLSSETATARAIRGGAVAHISDVMADPLYERKDAATAGGWRGGLAVPMLREGQVIGAIFVGRPNPGRFADSKIALLKTFADQAVIAIENVRLFNELEARNRELTEALEQQTSTSEILRVISQSPTDVQPVFDTIAGAALKLCSASAGLVFTFDGSLIHLAALANLDPAGSEAWRNAFPRPPSRDTAATRAVLTRSIVAIPDVLDDPDYLIGSVAAFSGFRSALAVPLMREGDPIGVVGVGRAEPGPFPDKQIALLQTFADQAVIAIENVRLFNETKEALERQTATAQVLKVISESPTDVQPVFNTIAERAKTLCGAYTGAVTHFDGELVHLRAFDGASEKAEEEMRALYPVKLGRGASSARAILERAPVQIADIFEDPDYSLKDAARTAGFRSVLAVPMLREGEVIGSIVVSRTQPGIFADKLVTLLQTFADQAVIAIENVRLFNELEARNREVTEALEQQTATSEILRVISRSPTDLQPVFDAIVRSANELSDGHRTTLVRLVGDEMHLAAIYHARPRTVSAATFPRRPGRDMAVGRAILDGALVHIPDVKNDPQYPQDLAHALDVGSAVSVPLMRDGKPIGAIGISRATTGAFPENRIELLKTFADQAVIAIENVRLFTELETRNRDLTEALEQQTATSEILRVISKSHTDVHPVFETIATAALKLCRATSGNLFTFDGELIHAGAHVNVNPEYIEAVRQFFPRPPARDTAVTRAVLTCSVVMIPDVLEDREYAIGAQSSTGSSRSGLDFRSILAVPLLREGSPIGAISVGRPEPGPFPEQQITLLKTFADQAVIAIENVRLFKELEARTAELTRSVEKLRALGEVGQAVSSTLDLPTVLRTIVSHAVELAGMDGGSIYEYDEAREQFHLHATHKLPEEVVEVLRAAPIPKGEGAIGRLAVTSEPVQIADIVDERSYQSRVREILIRLGYRSLLAVPLLREDHLLGGLVVNRKSAGEFAPEVIDLLKTFATQSALAIQNARLFREIEDKSRQLEIASQHKSEFLANMSHELRTPLNAIIGFSEVLYEKMFGEINDKQAEYLADILESGRHLLSLINDILDLSKIEAGRMELEPSEFDLPSAIENTLILVRERAQRRAITLRRTVDERVGTIRADERKVKQVLLNLLSNALKFTPEGGQIDVIAGVQDGVAEISVKDTGVGIAAADQDAVFEEFKQVGTASKKVEGTGLGLAISRKFIELHGGKIWVKSQPGKGSTFTFTLPLTIDKPIETHRTS